MTDYEPQPLPDDLPAEVVERLNSMTPQAAALYVQVHGDELRATARRNAALAVMSDDEKQVAAAARMTPEEYVKYRRPQS